MLLTPTTFTTLLLAASAVSAVPFGVAKDAGHASPTHTITTTMTKTATVTSGVASTAYAFKVCLLRLKQNENHLLTYHSSGATHHLNSAAPTLSKNEHLKSAPPPRPPSPW